MSTDEAARAWEACNDDIHDLMDCVESPRLGGDPRCLRRWRLVLSWLARRGSEACPLRFEDPILDLIDLRIDGRIGPDVLEAARVRLAEATPERELRFNAQTREDQAITAILTAAYMGRAERNYDALYYTYNSVASLFADPTQELVYQTAIFKDIFPNPFRPVRWQPSWQSSIVFALAERMYESRDFDAMPIFADALQDAGCENEAILCHCRGPGPHVRGCWVVDLVLGKK